MPNNLASWRIWWILVGIGVFLVVGAALPPFVAEPWQHVLMHAFSMVCHQLPDRSPHIADISFAVCHRCYGIYTGLLLSTVAFLILRHWDYWISPRIKLLLVVFALPLVVDWAVNFTPLPDNTPVSRMVTGGLLGLAVGFVAVRAFLGTSKQQAQPTKGSGTVSGVS